MKDDFRGKPGEVRQGRASGRGQSMSKDPEVGGYPRKMCHCYMVEANDRATDDLGHLFTLMEKETKLDSYFIPYPKTISQYIIDLNVIYHLEDREKILIALR